MKPGNINVELHTGNAAKPARPPLSPQELAQRRTADKGHALADIAACVAVGFGIIAFFYIAMFLWGTCETWGEAVRMVVLSALIAISLTILPPLATLTERTYPDKARTMHGVWLILVALSFIGVMSYGLTASPELSAKWQPKAYLPTTQIITASSVNQNAIRRLFMLAVSFGTIVGSGLMLQWSMLGSAESYRLAYGEVGPAPKAAQGPAPVALEGAAMATGEDAFSMWAEHRLRPQQNGRIQARDAYADYESTCLLNGIQPASEKKFGDLLTRKAATSNGRFSKTKIGGIHYYQGWELPEGAGTMDAEFEMIEGPR